MNDQLLNNPCVRAENTREIRRYFEVNDNKTQYIINCGRQLKQSSEREVIDLMLILEKKKP